MTLTAPQRSAAQQQVLRPYVAPVPPKTLHRFSVWMAADIPAHYTSIGQMCQQVESLKPAGQWDEIELLMKAGEGGSYQSSFDPHPLAISGLATLQEHVLEAAAYGVRISPYVNVRAQPQWIVGEQRMIHDLVSVAGRVVLNVEPGKDYYNGPLDPGFIRGYLAGIGVPAAALEVCMIPRAMQVAELGGISCLQAWTDPMLVGGASWECYGIAAPGYGASSLQVDAAIPRLDGWGVPSQLSFRVPVVQRDERDTWAETIWAAPGMAVWWADAS